MILSGRLEYSHYSALELLATSHEHVIVLTSSGALLRDNIDLFLSKKVINSFGHYAATQLRKLHNVLIDNKDANQQEKNLYKDAMHLVRLLITGADILEGKALKAYRTDEHELLLAIRNGSYNLQEIFVMAQEYERRFKLASEQTSLPDQPDHTLVEQLMIGIYKHFLCKPL